MLVIPPDAMYTPDKMAHVGLYERAPCGDLQDFLDSGTIPWFDPLALPASPWQPGMLCHWMHHPAGILRVVANLFTGVVTAPSIVHSEGYYHRDIKVGLTSRAYQLERFPVGSAGGTPGLCAAVHFIPMSV
jgi:hypothetical protein